MNEIENCQVCCAPSNAAERIMIMEATIKGALEMAQVEAIHGSKAWASAAKTMQQVLDGGPIDV